MPMEIFVSCVGDLPTLEGSELFVTPACFSPFLSLSLSLSVFFFLSARRWGMDSFTLSAPLCCDRGEFLRCGDRSKTRGTLAVCTNTRLERKCIAGLFRVFLIMDYLLRSAVYRLC